jgi:RES domain
MQQAYAPAREAGHSQQGTDRYARVASPVRLYRAVAAADVHRAFEPRKHVSQSRWTSRGTRAVVAATSPEGALLEALVHLEPGGPDKWHLVEACMRADAIADAPTPPQGWAQFPYRREVQQWGDALLKEGGALGYRVPSALVSGAFNVLLGAAGALGRQLMVESSLPLEIDARLRR